MSVFLLDTNDILPLPSIQAYATVSTLLLSCSIYYAIQVTSEPNWRQNSNLNLTFSPEALLGLDIDQLDNRFKEQLAATTSQLTAKEQQQNETIRILSQVLDRSTIERIVDVINLMFHEPLCIWTIINMALCYLMLVGKCIQKLVFGELRVSERQNLKKRFWNFIFIKFLIVFFVMNVHIMEEVVLWCSWFSIQAFLSMLTQLCNDRFKYLSISPTISRWTHTKLIGLLVLIILQSFGMFLIGCFINYYFGLSVFIFMVTECLLILVRTTHLFIRYMVYLNDLNQNSSWEKQSSFTYYTDFIFQLAIIFIYFVYYFHIVLWSNVLISFTNMVITIQLRNLICEFNRKLKKHRNYLQVVRLMEKNFPMASKEELTKNSDDCPICWDRMETGRKLPCGHLFHNFCLRSWLEQDTSCPTCRKSLRNHQIESPRDIPPAPAQNQFNFVLRTSRIHFDGPRYARWLPSVQVEVTRPVNPLNRFNNQENVLNSPAGEQERALDAATDSATSSSTTTSTDSRTGSESSASSSASDSSSASRDSSPGGVSTASVASTASSDS